MKKAYLIFLLILLSLTFSASAFAGKRYNSSTGYTKDVYGHWERNDNAYKDSDGDGVVNHFDRDNKNSSIW